jgi:hypothetical protein
MCSLFGQIIDLIKTSWFKDKFTRKTTATTKQSMEISNKNSKQKK